MPKSIPLIEERGLNSVFRYRVLMGDRKPDGSWFSVLHAYKAYSHGELYEVLTSRGFTLRFEKILGKALSYNLRIIDSKAPEILARLLLESNFGSTGEKFLKNLLKSVAKKNDIQEVQRLGSTYQDRLTSLVYKIKNVLLAFENGAPVSRRMNFEELNTKRESFVRGYDPIFLLDLRAQRESDNYLLYNAYFDNCHSPREAHGRLIFDEISASVFVDIELHLRLMLADTEDKMLII